MNKTSLIILAVLSISLLVLAGCVSSGGATGAVPRSPPAVPTGGGCGIAAPADAGQAAVAAEVSADSAL